MTTGPVPKRTDQRRRRNQPDVPVTTGAARPTTMPEPDDTWHPIAVRWYVSLGQSGQADFYQASDWAVAAVIAETLSASLGLQPIVVGKGKDAHVEFHVAPMSAAALTAFLHGATALLATEGDRRRMRLELERAAAAPTGTDEVEDELDAHRARRAGQPSGHHAGRPA